MRHPALDHTVLDQGGEESLGRRDRPTLSLPLGQLGPFQPLRPVGRMNRLQVVGFAGSIITGSVDTRNANGVRYQSPGLPRSGNPGSMGVRVAATPTLCPRVVWGVTEPQGIGLSVPRVGARSSRQPWALSRNAVGVRCHWWRLLAPIAEPDRCRGPSSGRIALAGARWYIGRRIRSRRPWSAAVGDLAFGARHLAALTETDVGVA